MVGIPVERSWTCCILTLTSINGILGKEIKWDSILELMYMILTRFWRVKQMLLFLFNTVQIIFKTIRVGVALSSNVSECYDSVTKCICKGKSK